jgi:hypothetical protein
MLVKKKYVGGWSHAEVSKQQYMSYHIHNHHQLRRQIREKYGGFRFPLVQINLQIQDANFRECKMYLENIKYKHFTF